MIQIVKPVKIESVSQVKEFLDKSNMALLTDYRGLTVTEISELRKKLREVGAEIHIVKNTLFRIAAKGTPAEALSPYLEGPTAATFTAGDVAATAKALTEFAKDHKQVQVKAGVVESHLYNPAQITALAKLPSREVMLAQIMGGLKSPATGIVGTMQSVMRQLMGTITAVAEKNAAA